MKKTAVCAQCGKLHFQNRWIGTDDPVKAIEKYYHVKPTQLIIKPGVKHAYKDLEVTVTLCDNCRREKSQYFEAIFQLRRASKEVIEFVLRQIHKQREKGIYVTKQEPVSNGIDLYITNQTFTRNLAQKTQQQFGGILKTNETLFSKNKQTSKNIYRLTVVLELPEVEKGEVIRVKEKMYVVQSTRQKIHCKEIRTGKPTAIGYEQPYEKVETFKTSIIKVKPHTEVLHPHTYEAIPVRPLRPVNLGEKVKLVLDKEAVVY